MFLPRLLLVLISGLLPHNNNSLVNATPNSVCNEPGYYSIRPCAKACVGCQDPRRDQIAFMIGCGDTPPNECWCATDLFTLATSALSDCVSRSCTIGGWGSDYTVAEAFYTSYCERNGFTGLRGEEVPVETTTSGASKGTRTRGSSGPTQAGTISGDGNGEGNVDSPGVGLSRSDKIALGVGIGLGLPATFAGILTCLIQMRARWGGNRVGGEKVSNGLPTAAVR